MFRSRNRTRAMDGLPGGAAYWYRQVKNVFVSGGYDGFILDAGDISTLDQESTGKTPVTAVTQPIGWFGDKHLGMQLGPELVTNGDFSSGTTGWSAVGGASLAAVAGELEITGAGGAFPGGRWVINTVVGKAYKVTAVCRRGTSESAIQLSTPGGTTSTSSTSNVALQVIFVAIGTTSNIQLLIGSATGTGTVYGDIVSVRLLDGNHALQATAAARPTWQVDANGRHYAQFLGTDDSLSCATGGGGSTGFLFCAALKPTGGAGGERKLYSDFGTNTGYAARITSTNKFALSAGNGVGFTTTVSAATVDVGTTYLLTCWDDGMNLNVQINAATAETVARPVVVAGSAGCTLGKDNGFATAFFIGDFYRAVYINNWAGTAAQLAAIQSWVKAGAGL